MTILPQSLPMFLIIYWQTLASCFAELQYASLLERCSNHLLVKLAQSVDFSPLETACASYHHQSGPGKPTTYSTNCLMRALLVGWIYQLSLRELEQRLCSDLLVRWFVGLGWFDETPDHTTLERFELWVRDQQPTLFFDTIREQILEQFPKERQRAQIGDTYGMQANAADEGLVRRIRHVSQNLLVELVKALPGSAERSLCGYEWVELFGLYPEEISLRLDAKKRAECLNQTALAADELYQRVERLLGGYSSQAYPAVRHRLKHLGKVLGDEVSFQADEAGGKVASELPVDKKGEYRLISGADPEATLRVHNPEQGEKTVLGYNVQVAVSTSGFIHETFADTGARPDQAGVADLVAGQIESEGTCPPKLIYDKAAGAGKTRSEVAQVSQGQCQLSARLPDYEQHRQRFGPYDFSLSEDGKSLTCPAGKVSTQAYPSTAGDGVNFRFHAFQCWNGDPPTCKQASQEEACARRCPLWEQCRDARQDNQARRLVFISDYRSEVLAARKYNQTKVFKQDMKLRPRIERIIFELTHYNGARRCRRRGLLNADFQAHMCATVYNLKLWVRRLDRRQLENRLPVI